MPVIEPFRALRPICPAVYVPGEESPRFLGDLIAVNEGKPALFLYRQCFRMAGDSADSVRDGVMGLLNRREAELFPHEETDSDRVAACGRIIDTPEIDPGSLWLWCNDADGTLRAQWNVSGPAMIESADRFGCFHQVWPVTQPEQIATLQKGLQGKPLFLADGHHRFAAGWNLATVQIRNQALQSRPSRVLGAVPEIDKIEMDARRGVLLPPKSTDFFPKLAAGLIISQAL